jgi:hypothetical protein
MNKATTTLFLTLGILAGIMGIEHGIGEVLEGYRPTEGVFLFCLGRIQPFLKSCLGNLL